MSWDMLALPLPAKLAGTIVKHGRAPRDGENLSLWLDKLVHRRRSAWTLDKADRTVALGAFCEKWTSSLGKAGLERIRQSMMLLHPSPGLHWRAAGRLEGRLLVDYGRSTVTETSVSMHPFWGVPRIPGSALKGITRAEMRLQGVAAAQMEAIFGGDPGSDKAARGAVVFYDAYPLGGRFSLAPDVLTPHYREYYDGKGPPADWEDPIPHSFLTVVNATFEIHLGAIPAPDGDERRAVEHLQATVGYLTQALKLSGVGAKTAAGYGRLVLDAR